MTSHPLRVFMGSAQPASRRGAGRFVRPKGVPRLAFSSDISPGWHRPSGLEAR